MKFLDTGWPIITTFIHTKYDATLILELLSDIYNLGHNMGPNWLVEGYFNIILMSKSKPLAFQYP